MRRNDRGTTYLALMTMLALAFTLCAMLVQSSSHAYLATANLRDSLAALNLAEAGIQRALYELNYAAAETVSLDRVSLGNGAYRVRLSTAEGKIFLTSTGFVPAERSRMEKTLRAELLHSAGGYSIAQLQYVF
jgi:Tfp pilus assembly protein PilX